MPLNFVHYVCIKNNFSMLYMMLTPMKLLTNQQCDPCNVVIQVHYELLGSELKNYVQVTTSLKSVIRIPVRSRTLKLYINL